jgi:mono/diheme cytochrome c family protein
MKNFIFGALAAVALLFVGTLVYLRLGFAEVRGDVVPLAWETRLLDAAVHASVRREAPELANPVQPTDENLIAGGKAYLDGCAGCHGTPGKHPAWREKPTLYPPAPQLPDTGTEYTEAQIFWIAKHGIRRTGMFANGAWSDDKELWTLAGYIARIKSLPPAVAAALAKPPEAQH